MAEKKTNKLTGAAKERAKKVFGKGKTLGDLVKKTVSKYKQGTKAQSKKVADKKPAKKTTRAAGSEGYKPTKTNVGPNYAKPKRKSTADKTSVVNRKTTGMKSEKTGPDMSRGTPKRGNVQRGSETYNQGPSMLKSSSTRKTRPATGSGSMKSEQKRKQARGAMRSAQRLMGGK